MKSEPGAVATGFWSAPAKHRGPQRGSRGGVVVAATALWSAATSRRFKALNKSAHSIYYRSRLRLKKQSIRKKLETIANPTCGSIQRISLNVTLNRKTWRSFLLRNLTRFVLILVLSLGLVLFFGMTETGGRIGKAMMLFIHVARLHAKAPDTELALPVKDVKKNQIPNSWQAPRGEDRLHQGQDIFAPRGTPILSATTGYVVRIGENALGGQTVWVIGNGGRRFYYAHLDSYATDLEVGDYVTRETVLGYVGTTGNAQGTRPHLHFGVYTNTGAIDPLPLLIDRVEEPKVNAKPEATISGIRRRQVSRPR